MSWYLGPVGNLQAIEAPETFSADHSIPGGLHQTLSGARVRDRVGAPKRSFSMSWTALTAEQFGVIRGLALGAYGPGPMVLVDPGERNLMAANLSSGTDVLRDTTGFTSVGSALPATLSSSTAAASQGVRSLAAVFPVSASGAQTFVATSSISAAAVNPARDAVVVAGLTYVFTFRLAGSVPGMVLEPDLIWCDSAGAYFAEVNGSNVTILGSLAFATATVTGTAPAGAATVAARFSNVNAVGAPATVYADSFQLEQAAAATAWVPGMGSPRVAFDDIPVSYPAIPYSDVSVNLTEL